MRRTTLHRATATVAVVAVLAVAGAVVAGPQRRAGVRPDPVAAAAPPLRIAYYGDSLSHESEAAFRVELERGDRPVDLTYHARIGSALCDWTPQILADSSERTDLVVVAFAGNPGLHCGRPVAPEELHDRYLDDARAVMAVSPGEVLFVAPPAFADPVYRDAGRQVRNAYDQVVAEHPQRARLVDGGTHLTPDGTWHASLPCLPDEPCTGPVVDGVRHNLVRSPDGIHLCPDLTTASNWFTCEVHNSGAYRYALAIADSVLAPPQA